MRGKTAKRREPTSDSIYSNRMIAKLINRLMRDGKKTAAENVVYKAFALIEKKNEKPLDVFDKALQNVGPKQEVKARRVGGASYQIPIEVRGERKVSLAIRWIIAAARARSNKDHHTFEEKLALELMEAAQNQGSAVKKRDTVQRTADANRAFAHFRW